MRRVFIGLLLLCGGCDQLSGGLSTSEKEAVLLRRLEEAEKRIEVLEHRSGGDRVRIEARINSCLAEAEERYWSYVKLNGGRQRPNSTIWTAPQTTWAQAAQNKQNDMSECRARYASN